MISLRYEAHYGQRVVAAFTERPANIDAMFRAARVRDANALALIAAERRMTYGELDQTVDRMAGNLAQLGIAKGDRVALLLGNNPVFVEASLACARLGAIQVPINVRQRRAENEYVLAHSGAVALIHEAELASELPEPSSVPSLRHRFAVNGAAIGSRPYDALLAPTSPPPKIALHEDEPACILYTSGTTGQPKGAILTHFGLIHTCLNYEQAMALGSAERAMLAVPASHVTGIAAIILTMIRVGGCTVMMPAFKARTFLELMAAERVTFTLIVPAMYNLCLLDPEFARFDLSSWQGGGYGGAPMPIATIERLARELPNLKLYNAYGATETTSPVTLLSPDQAVARADTVGKELPGADIRVMDEEGREVPPGSPGELWIAGPMVVPGYWNNPEATATNFTGGYWRSGDIGSIDRDGYVRVFDRKKDMINRGGYKVYTAEVENLLNHHPAVIEAAVVGRPDPVLGERVQAFIVARDASASETEIRAFCAARLSDYKVPDRVVFLNQPLPRNANGKVLKGTLRQML
ncbi:MAG: long-chain fatty acid--CoA ligase [Alphaproteobacteria bacterium]|nr:long-chain fatty acid--CoA ligase [Alphaproteobacteria bacterium]